MVLKELNGIGNKFFIQEGVVYTLSSLTTLEQIEKEMKREIEANLTINSGKETLIKMLGSAIEYFTDKGWKVCFLDEKENNLHFVLAAPFVGGIMKGKGLTPGTENQNYEIYIPSGYLGMEIIIKEFPKMYHSCIRLLPNIQNMDFKSIFLKYKNAYKMVHPHLLSDERLCSGLPQMPKFDINMVVSQVEACIKGGNTSGTSLLDYNSSSPAVKIEDCTWGLKALKWHTDKKTDDDIWKELIKHDRT